MALAVAFDTLKLARKLEAAGFEHQQAADVSEAMAEAFAIAEVATKADVRELELRLEAKIDRLAAANKADIDRLAAANKADTDRLAVDIERLAETTKAELREARAEAKAESTTIRSDMKAMELRMTIKLGLMLMALFATTIGAVAAIMRFMLH
ncbi:MAG: hypothetical protein FD149_69 [Rhodospirillaceae bacterium]|nr:MAG: hypothetical protein FD149_69 [Rhodospirillaceae bacterium]